MILPVRVAQSEVGLTQEPEDPGSIPGHLLLLPLPLIQDG